MASLLATRAFQASILLMEFGNSSSTATNDSNYNAWFSILADNYLFLYTLFLNSNTTGFLVSLIIILVLINGSPLRRRFFMWVLLVIMWVAISASALAYLVSVAAFTPEFANSLLLKSQGNSNCSVGLDRLDDPASSWTYN
ncbi:hypothetical protein REPUB_Repub03eG0102000 [Reevesia pubescens]